MAAAREFDRDGRGDGGLPHAAFAHRHDDAAPRPLDFVDQRGKREPGPDRAVRPTARLAVRRDPPEYRPEVVMPMGAYGSSGTSTRGNFAERRRHAREGFAAAGFERARRGIGPVLRDENAIQEQPLVGHSHLGQFGPRAIGFGERRAFRPAHQDERGRGGIGQRAQAGVVERLLRFEAGQRPETGGAGGVGGDESGPRGRELEQA